MDSLTFSKVGDRYESVGDVQFLKDTVLEINFNDLSEHIGASIIIYQSLTKTGWCPVFSDVVRGPGSTTWCKLLAGVSEAAYYKVAVSVNPTSAFYGNE